MTDQRPTPYFLYDLDRIRRSADALRAALPADFWIAYAAKANPHPRILALMTELVDQLDVSSTGEIDAALAAGWRGDRLTFSGPAKNDAAIAKAAAVGARITGEAEDQLARIRRVAPDARVVVRVNPSQTFHAYRVAMGGVPSSFGIDEEQLERAERRFGLQVFAGSECSSVGGVMRVVTHTLDLVERIGPFEWVSFGGGLVPDFDVAALGAKLHRALDKFAAATGYRPACGFELGRYFVADAGRYVASVVSTKTSRGERFAILDGGMNHVLFATGHLGGAPKPVRNLTRAQGPTERVHLAGPLCTPLDRFGVVELVAPRVGDRIAFEGVGAYGLSASPHGFIQHARPEEVIEGEQL